MKAYVLIKENLADRRGMDEIVSEVVGSSINHDLLIAMGHEHNRSTGMGLEYDERSQIWWDNEEGFITMSIHEIEII